MTYEVTTLTFGETATWTIEAKNLEEARKLAKKKLNEVRYKGYITDIRPVCKTREP